MSGTREPQKLNHAGNHVDLEKRDLKPRLIDFPQLIAQIGEITQDHDGNHVGNHVDLQARDLTTFPQVRKSRLKSRLKSRTPLYVVEGA
jgi:hypothetical protein